MNRRSMLRTIPAAIALAILPSRLTRAVRAAEPRADGITVYGVPDQTDWIPNAMPMPKTGYLADHSFDGGLDEHPAIMSNESATVYVSDNGESWHPLPQLHGFTITDSSPGWGVNRWPGIVLRDLGDTA